MFDLILQSGYVQSIIQNLNSILIIALILLVKTKSRLALVMLIEFGALQLITLFGTQYTQILYNKNYFVFAGIIQLFALLYIILTFNSNKSRIALISLIFIALMYNLLMYLEWIGVFLYSFTSNAGWFVGIVIILEVITVGFDSVRRNRFNNNLNVYNNGFGYFSARLRMGQV